MRDLPRLAEIGVPRCFKPVDFGEISTVQLHLFCDASDQGYGVVAYLRLVNTNEDVHCSLVMGKSRVAPLKKVTTPRMELTAATTAVRLGHKIQNILDYKIEETIYWTDSMAVLRYISNEHTRYQTFVANHLAVIRDGSEKKQWRYVNTTLNPADQASRGITVDDKQRSESWFKGPAFLWQDELEWPQVKMPLSIEHDDPEVKKCVNVAIEDASDNALDDVINKFSSWPKVKRIVAWLLVAVNKFRQKITNRLQMTQVKFQQLHLPIDMVEKAETILIQHVQNKHFRTELNDLEEYDAVKKNSQLYKLDPFTKDGIIRVGGRLDKAVLPYDAKHPIVLPKNCVVSKLILEDCHRHVGHLGKNTMMSHLRHKFWILGASAAIKSITSKCVVCRRYQARTCQQKMADLPSDRLRPDEPPFTNVGLDYFGPIEVKRGRSIVKRYGVIFTCMSTRAVHLEVAFSLDTDSCINALRRFISRRGPVKLFVSDNGTNLVAAERELREEIEQWNKNKIMTTLQQQGIRWQFNPPAGSHFGGVWERLIRSIRKIMYSLMKDQVSLIKLDDEGLQTLFCEIEAILNSRPITVATSNPNDLEPLTPNHLLLMHPGQDLPCGVFSKDDCYAKRRWRQIQYMADLFWKRWVKEYLPTLQTRQKWNKPRRNVSVGDIVLVADNSPRSSWSLGRVISVKEDKRGLVRRVMLRIRGTVLERPIDKLCPILEADVSV